MWIYSTAMDATPDTAPEDGQSLLFNQSLEKGLAVLRAFSARRRTMTLADVAAATDITKSSAQRMVFTLAALLTFLIGVSRVYIGVHFPSDVAGGWAAGLAWLAICITGYEVVSGRSASHRPLAPSPETP